MELLLLFRNLLVYEGVSEPSTPPLLAARVLLLLDPYLVGVGSVSYEGLVLA